MNFRRKKNRGALKFSRLLQEYVDQQGKPSSYSLLLVGQIKLAALSAIKLSPKQEAEAMDEAAAYLWDSYSSGCRSRFLYLALYRYFERDFAGDNRLLLSFIYWGMSKGLDIGHVLEARKLELSRALFNRPATIEAIYRVYPETWILRELVREMTRRDECGLNAFQYYKAAESKQISLPQLPRCLIQAAFHNKMEDVSRYSMEQFLRQHSRKSDEDNELTAFLYHLLLTKKNLKELSVGYEQDIMRFAFYALDSRLSGRTYNSIYHFLMSALQGPLSMGNKKLLEYAQAAEAIVLENLFCYHCYIDYLHEDAKILYVMEDEKKEPARYVAEDGEAVIKAVGENFSCVILGMGGRQVIEAAPRVTRCLESADIPLYLHFYRKGFISDDLLITLTKYYMTQGGFTSGDAVQERSAAPEKELVDILNKLLALKTISPSFRMQAAAFLGGLLAGSQDQYDLALQYYRDVNEDYLQDKYIEQMFKVFMSAKEYDRAVSLLIKKSHCITDRTLFFALKRLSKEEKYHSSIVHVAYELILKSWYDKCLLDVVLKNYNGGQREWQELSMVLSGISVFEPELDEIILKNSIWMHKLDEGSQRVFVRMYENSCSSSLLDDFVYYCIYEIMINLAKPLYETIVVLEKIYLKHREPYLAFALSTIYLEHGITTFESEKILHEAVNIMEEQGLLFSSFKNAKDKTLITPYIEKNQTFTYRTLPDKKVFLYYKFEGDDTYSVKPMRYLRYGLYQTTLIFFYGDKLSYYYSEELPTGSITTREAIKQNNEMMATEERQELYYVINDALIFEQMFRYERVESIITDLLKDSRNIKGDIM